MLFFLGSMSKRVRRTPGTAEREASVAEMRASEARGAPPTVPGSGRPLSGTFGGAPRVHWLAFQRQRPPVLQCQASLALFYTYFKNQHLFGGGPILTLKSNAKHPCGLQTYTFPLKIQYLLCKIIFSPNMAHSRLKT